MIYNKALPFSNTIYSRYPLKNSGGDNQLTLRSKPNIPDISRVLLGSDYDIDYQYEKYDLLLYASRGDIYTGLPITLSLHPVTVSWDPGIYLDSSNYLIQTHEASTWVQRFSGSNWGTAGGDYSESALQASFTSKTLYDGVYFQGLTEQFSNGFLLKYDDETKNIGDIWMYSANSTSPLYPRMVFYIDDYTWTASSNDIVDLQDYIVDIPDLKYYFNNQEKVNLKLKLYPKHYERDWTSSVWQNTQTNSTIPQQYSASYAVYDVTTIQELQFIPHSQYTRLSCDGTYNYFGLDMSQFQVNRKYRIQIKAEDRIYPIRNIFKIV